MAFDRAAYMRMYRAKQRREQLVQRVPDLTWPTNLFGQPLKIEELMAPGSFVPNAKPLREDLCACGCNMPHNNGYAKTLTDRSGPTPKHTVMWFRTFGHATQAQRRAGT